MTNCVASLCSSYVKLTTVPRDISSSFLSKDLIVAKAFEFLLYENELGLAFIVHLSPNVWPVADAKSTVSPVEPIAIGVPGVIVCPVVEEFVEA